MSNENNTQTTLKLAIIGKFNKLHDEEYIARSFEALGVSVYRITEKISFLEIKEILDWFEPDYVMWFKLSHGQAPLIRDYCKKFKTICWVFDLYWGYQRENRLKSLAFTADYVFSTDNGHEKEFKGIGIRHNCVRQGIYDPECWIHSDTKVYDVVFVGSNNPYYLERTKLIEQLQEDFDLEWFGKHDTNEIRGEDLNILYSQSRIVVGDSVYSPHYWSNRVVETLGRGGFLIHREVEGLKEAYPYLVTYNGTYEDLKSKIEYYLEHDKEREEIIIKNYEWVKDNYTATKQCQKLLNYIS